MTSVLNKVFTREFYRINAGFFLIVIGICFGFLRDVEHLALAQYFISAPVLLGIPILVWMLYTLKILSFNHHAVHQSENSFVYSSALVPARLATSLVLVSVQQLMPALLYGAFLLANAWYYGQLPAVAGILIALGSFICLVSGRLYWDIAHPDDEVKVSWLRSKINLTITKPYVWFYPAWILRRQPVLILGTKVFAMLIIIGVSRLYLFDTYDERLFEMGCALAFASNLVLVYYYHRFENFHFSMLRTLPLPLSRRMGHFIVTFMILLLPETVAMINYLPAVLSIMQLTTVILFGYSVVFLGYAWLFIKDINLERVIQRVFVMAFLWIVLILFKVPVPVMLLVQVLTALVTYHRHFYSFEFDASIESEK